MDWDPEVESPATIAIIGAGPAGIEAALYARFLGYYVILLEQSKPAANQIRWGKRSLERPLRNLTSSLGRKALIAQQALKIAPNELFTSPEPATGIEWANEYLTPLVKSDLLADSINAFTRLVDVSRFHSFARESIPAQDRCNDEFRLLLHSEQRGYWIARADVVIDCSGRTSRRLGIAPGGGIAAGQIELAERIDWELPRWLDKDSSRYRDRKIVLWGDGPLARQAAMDWLDMPEQLHEGSLLWIVPNRSGDPRQERINQSVQTISKQLESKLVKFGFMLALGIERISAIDDEVLQLEIRTTSDSTIDLKCNRLVNLIDELPDWSIAMNLQLDPTSVRTAEHRFLLPEPHYYVLGYKAENLNGDSYVNLDYFDNIRKLFAMLGGRETLDLYSSQA